MTISVSPRAVIDAARDAGIEAMWDNERHRHELGSDQRGGWYLPEVGIGQYPVTVLDEANAMEGVIETILRAVVSQPRRASG